jgi:hypothetical protein
MFFKGAVVGGAIGIKFAVVLEHAIVVVALLGRLLAVSIGGAVRLPFEAEKLEAVETGGALQLLAPFLALNGRTNSRVRCR